MEAPLAGTESGAVVGASWHRPIGTGRRRTVQTHEQGVRDDKRRAESRIGRQEASSSSRLPSLQPMPHAGRRTRLHAGHAQGVDPRGRAEEGPEGCGSTDMSGPNIECERELRSAVGDAQHAFVMRTRRGRGTNLRLTSVDRRSSACKPSPSLGDSIARKTSAGRLRPQARADGREPRHEHARSGETAGRPLADTRHNVVERER
jgi:hypothetical protein